MKSALSGWVLGGGDRMSRRFYYLPRWVRMLLAFSIVWQTFIGEIQWKSVWEIRIKVKDFPSQISQRVQVGNADLALQRPFQRNHHHERNLILLRIHFPPFGCQAVSHLQPRNERDTNPQSFSDYTSQYIWKKGNGLGNGVSSLLIP